MASRAREQALLREVRLRLSKDRALPARLRRIERMEHTARVWVNGEEIGGEARFDHLAESHD